MKVYDSLVYISGQTKVKSYIFSIISSPIKELLRRRKMFLILT